MTYDDEQYGIISVEVKTVHTYESFEENEVRQFFNEQKPAIWQTYTRIDPETMKTVYVLKWI